MIITRWQPWFTKQYGGAFPVDRFHYDVESSGFSRKDDVIVEWGHCMVRDGKVVDRNNIVINWYKCPEAIPPSRLTNQLERIRREMRNQGRSWRLTEEVLRDEGVHPDKAIPWIYELLTEVQQQGMMLVSHNGWNFDNPMLVEHFRQDLNKEFAFNPNQIFDTGCIEKASQLMSEHPERALPKEGETLLDYFKRISGWRASGVYSNLDTHCLKKYKLVEKYGLDPTKMHTAGEDAYALHCLMEEFKVLCEACKTPPAAAPVAAAAPIGLPPRPAKAVVRPQTPIVVASDAAVRAVASSQPAAPIRRKQRNR